MQYPNPHHPVPRRLCLSRRDGQDPVPDIDTGVGRYSMHRIRRKDGSGAL